MTANKDGEWLKEYQEFIQTEPVAVPTQIYGKVLTQITDWLNPHPFMILGKILGIHLLTGFLSLSICHQFEMNPFHTSFSISDWLMHFGGHHVCMLGCGIIFVGLGLLAAGYFLTVEEVRTLRRTSFLQIFILALISLGLFTAFGAQLALGISALWLFGGLIGGYLATETVWHLRKVSYLK